MAAGTGPRTQGPTAVARAGGRRVGGGGETLRPLSPGGASAGLASPKRWDFLVTTGHSPIQR